MSRNSVKNTTLVGDIVQVNPNSKSPFSGCLIIVTETNDTGLNGFIQYPGEKESQRCYISIKWNKVSWCGVASWIPNPEDEEVEECDES